MDFGEVLELHKAVSVFHDKTAKKRPKLGVFDTQNRSEGYALCIKNSCVKGNFQHFLDSLVRERKLATKEFRGYLMIYSLRIN